MPRYGFNFLWMFSRWGDRSPQPPALDELDFLAHYGFDFVRIPTDYRFWTKDFDYFHPDERVFEQIDRYLAACQERGLHMNLNIHRAPGYCINGNHLEKHNLWLDKEAQDAFVFLWETFTRRYRAIPNEQLSFDLLNEPPNVGQYGFTRENHAAVMRRTVAAIRAIHPERQITIDGIGGGGIAVPELADLGVIHSGRGYAPMPISHYQATWWDGHEGLEEPVYPGLEWDGKIWNRDTLAEYYRPWREVQSQGVAVHIGEMGCYSKTPNDVALRWFSDLLGLFKEYGWGYSLWNFVGAFGIINHGRPGARIEKMRGFDVDRDLFDLVLQNRV